MKNKFISLSPKAKKYMVEYLLYALGLGVTSTLLFVGATTDLAIYGAYFCGSLAIVSIGEALSVFEAPKKIQK